METQFYVPAEATGMFLGINSTPRRRVLRAALMAYKDYIRTHDGPTAPPAAREDVETIDSILREINAAESLNGVPVTHSHHPE